MPVKDIDDYTSSLLEKMEAEMAKYSASGRSLESSGNAADLEKSIVINLVDALKDIEACQNEKTALTESDLPNVSGVQSQPDLLEVQESENLALPEQLRCDFSFSDFINCEKNLLLEFPEININEISLDDVDFGFAGVSFAKN